MKFYYALLALYGLAPTLSLAQPSTATEAVADSAIRLLPPVSVAGLNQPESLDEPLPGPTEDVIALADLEALALANNPALSVLAARVEVRRGDRVQAGLPPNPVAGYLASEIGNEGRAGQQGAFVGQEIVTGGKLRLSQAVATQDIRIAEQQLAMLQRRVLNDVRLAYYDALIAQQRIEVSQRLVEISGRAVETANLFLQRAEGNRVDLLQSQVEAGSARILLQNSKNDLTAAWRTLAAVVGVSDLEQAPLAGELNTDDPKIDFEEAYERIRMESPETAAAQVRVDRAQFALQRAVAQRTPNVDLQASVQHDNATDDEIAGVQAGIPLPLWNRNQGGIRSARAELAAAESDVRRVEQDLKRRLVAVFQRYENAKQQVQAYKRDILPDAKSSLDLVTAGYREGEFGYLALLTSQRTFFQTNLLYLESLRELKRQRALIDGMLLTNSLAETE